MNSMEIPGVTYMKWEGEKVNLGKEIYTFSQLCHLRVSWLPTRNVEVCGESLLGTDNKFIPPTPLSSHQTAHNFHLFYTALEQMLIA